MSSETKRTNEADAGAQTVTAGLVVIGDEILSGRTKDRNVGHIAEQLTAVGIRLEEVRIVPDREAAIVAAVNALRAAYTYVFTTGGIGPTHDDITADAIARALGVAIDIDPRAVAMMRERYGEERLTPARLRMARIPEGAELIANTISATPGFMIANVIVLAGVPDIMQVMLDAVLPRLRKGRPMHAVAVEVSQPEGDIAPMFADLQAAFPDVAMGSYPFFRDGRLGTQLVLRSTSEARLAKAEAALRARLAERGWL